MPDPSTFQPSLAQASKPTLNSLRRAAYHLLGFLAFLVLVFVLWAPLELFPGLRVDRFGSIERFRFLGATVFAAFLFLRFLIRPPKQPSLTSIAWGEFARATGGALSERMRRPGSTRWTGGTSVRWDSGGSEMKLSATTDADRNETTQLVAIVRLKRGFQFQLVQENLLTKIFFSQQLWNVALAAVKAERGNPRNGGKGALHSSAVADRLAFLASKEIVVGDPKFDSTFLLKSDTAALAREFFGDAGVVSSLYEMNEKVRNWQFSLMSRDAASSYQLTLAVPGTMLDPLGLDASKKLIEASIRCFADRGLLASMDPQAA